MKHHDSKTCGIILTNDRDLSSLYRYYREVGYNGLKVVTGWGFDEPWTDLTRARAGSYFGRLLVRTVAGDFVSTSPTYLHYERVLHEISPWLEAQPHAMIELGNEPNASWSGDDYIFWLYRYYLHDTITRIRKRYPDVTIVSPAPSPDQPGFRRFLEICRDVIEQCDYVGVHVYGSFSLAEPRVTNVLTYYDHMFSDKTKLITEFGIYHAQGRDRIKLYRQFIDQLPPKWAGGYIYHRAVDGVIDPNYAV